MYTISKYTQPLTIKNIISGLRHTSPLQHSYCALNTVEQGGVESDHQSSTYDMRVNKHLYYIKHKSIFILECGTE
jgi:hypothetical protein